MIFRGLICWHFWLLLTTSPAHAAFHLWHIKEVFSNDDGSVQFIEMFDSFAGENFVDGLSLTSNSDGVIKHFEFPDNVFGLSTANSHILIATSGFGALPGSVTPTFTFDQGGVTGTFFNQNATNISISFNGSTDTMDFSGASLPKDGIRSLTDAGAFGFPPGSPNISPGVNSPTNFAGAAGSIDVSQSIVPNGDYNQNGAVDAADYTVWRDTLDMTVTTRGSGADGIPDGMIDLMDYDFWKAEFGELGRARFAEQVPESGAILILALSALGAIPIRCR